MKKNKKYWKKQAKGWKEIARIESEQANDWAKRALKAEEELESANEVIGEYYDQIETLEDQVLYFKYVNQPNPPKTKMYTTFADDITNSVTSGNGWSKNVPYNPDIKLCSCGARIINK